MRPGHLVALTRQNLRRNRSSLALSSIGIIVGVASLVFFLALGEGMKSIVLERIFVVDQLEVRPRSYNLGLFKVKDLGGINRGLDDAAVERLRKVDGVAAAFPKLRFAFKAMAWTGEELFGKAVYFELFGDGIDPDQVPEFSQRAEDPFIDRRKCSDTQPCIAGLSCVDGRCQGPTCDPKGGPGTCPPQSHCPADRKRCEPDIPVLVSPHLMEMYNGSVAAAFGMPALSESSVIGLGGTMRMGRSFAGREAGGPVVERRMRIVGVSPKAISFGTTLPISYVRDFNALYRKDDQGGYDSVVVKVTSNERIPSVVTALEDRDGSRGLGFELAPRSKAALQAGLMISVLTLVFSLISLIIVGLSAINIAHTFFMILSERRSEIGLLRAVGASRVEVRAMVLLESAVIGVVGGVGGGVVGWAAMLAVDLISGRYLPDFPYKPDSYFHLAPSQLLMGLGVAVAFCLVGAWLPARRAAAMDPARALTGR